MSLSELNKKAKMSRGAQSQNKRKFSESRQGPTEQKYQFDYSSNYRDVEKFSVCRRLLASEVGKAFGEAANIIEHGEHFVFFPPDYPDDDEWNDPDVGPRVRMEYGTEYSAYVKLKTAYDTKCAQVYHLIWSKCTISMQNAVKEHADFNVWDRHKDVLNLWLRIVDISMNGTGAAENESKRINEAKHRFDRVHQRQNESVGEFYYRFNENYDAMVSQGAHLVQPLIPGGLTNEQLQEIFELHAEQEELLKSMSFLNKLDKIRYSGLMDDLDNAKQFGRDEYPKTLVDAYSLANRYRKNGVRIDSASRGRVERYDAAFVTADGRKSSNATKNEKKQQKEAKSNVTCYHCDEIGHVRSKCPMLAKAIKYFSKTGKTIDQLKEEVKDILVSFKGLEEFILSEQSRRPFDEKDLLLDNQASISVFCNENYVTNIRKADQEILIAGVSKDKLKTTLVADVKGLGTVYYNPNAIANILCFYDMNKRFGVKFDKFKFSMKVPMLDKSIHFVPKGKLYVCTNANFLLDRCVKDGRKIANLTKNSDNFERVQVAQFASSEAQTLTELASTSCLTTPLLKKIESDQKPERYSEKKTIFHSAECGPSDFGDEQFPQSESKSRDIDSNRLAIKSGDEPNAKGRKDKGMLTRKTGSNKTWSQSEVPFSAAVSGENAIKGSRSSENQLGSGSLNKSNDWKQSWAHGTRVMGSSAVEYTPRDGTSRVTLCGAYQFRGAPRRQTDDGTSASHKTTSSKSDSPSLKTNIAKFGTSDPWSECKISSMSPSSVASSNPKRASFDHQNHCTLVPGSCSLNPNEIYSNRSRIDEVASQDFQFLSCPNSDTEIYESSNDVNEPDSTGIDEINDEGNKMVQFDQFRDATITENDRTAPENDTSVRSHYESVTLISPAITMMKDHCDGSLLTTSEGSNDSLSNTMVLINTVEGNLLKFTKREVKDAEVAQQLYTMLGKPSMKDYLNMIRHNHIKDCPVTVKDVERALAIYGKDLGTIMGRTVSYKPDSLNDEIFVRREQDYTSLCIDIMFVNGLAFLVSISKGYNVLVVRYLNDRKMSTVELAVKQTIASYSKHDVIIKMIVCDGESAISALKASIEGVGVQLEQASKNEHVASIERAIRQIKERVRAFLHSLPFQATKEITIYLVYYIVGMINNIPRSTSVVEMSPKEKLTGKKLDYKLDFKLQFGDYCQANEEDNLKNSMKSRTFPAICLGPVGNIQSSYYFLNLNSWQVVKRRQWIKLPIPNDVIDNINAKAKTQQSKMPISNERLMSLNEDEENEVVEDTIDEQVPQWNYEPDYFHEEEADDPNGNEPDYFHEEEYQSEANEEHTNDEVAQESERKTHGYNLRKTPQREAWNNKFDENIFLMYFNVLATYNIKKAVQEYGDEGTQSMLKEMKQLHDKDVFEPMDYN